MSSLDLLKTCKRISALLILITFAIGTLHATPPCQVLTQAFASIADGATSDPSATGWSLSPTTISGATYWGCLSHRIKAQQLGAEGVWTSKVMSISGYPNIQVGIKVTA